MRIPSNPVTRMLIRRSASKLIHIRPAQYNRTFILQSLYNGCGIWSFKPFQNPRTGGSLMPFYTKNIFYTKRNPRQITLNPLLITSLRLNDSLVFKNFNKSKNILVSIPYPFKTRTSQLFGREFLLLKPFMRFADCKLIERANRL